MKRIRRETLGVLWPVTIVVMLLFCVGSVTAGGRTYTTDADFDEGVLVGVEHETVHDQLQLSRELVVLPFIWVPNSNEGTVSKIDTETGDELGRYRVAPVATANPSRTTVDLDGSCWVGNRWIGTVVKIGLYEAGQYIDRNGNGTIETSSDINGDGDITGAEILPWGQDECVMFEVVLIPGHEGTYAPGTYAGPYESNDWGVSPRGLAVDANNNVWAGTWITSKYFYLDGATGAILKMVDVSAWGHHAYGAVMDGNGVLWSSGQANYDVLKLDPSTDPPTIGVVNFGHFVYGLGLDYNDHLFVSGWTDSRLARLDVLTATIDWSYPKPELYGSRGVAATSDNNVWIAVSDYNQVVRYDNDGNHVATIPVGATPTGVAVDAAGKVWVCDFGDEYVHRIDPSTNTIDLSKRVIGGLHYSYSDMTGIVARTITTRLGTWTVVYDSGVAGTPWGTISWNSDEPAGTSITVEARSSDDMASWSPWEAAGNGVPLASTPNGRYIEIKTTLQIHSGDISPILYDLTVEPAFIEVSVDIKPTSCPNPLNTNSQGVLPVAVLGTEDFDVSAIDPSTVLLEGVPPLRWSYEDVATPFDGELCDCHGLGPDGNLDLTLKFDRQAIVAAIEAMPRDLLVPGLEHVNGGQDPRDVALVAGPREYVHLTLTGMTVDGIPVTGQDCVRVMWKTRGPHGGGDPFGPGDPAGTITEAGLSAGYAGFFASGAEITFSLPEPAYVSLAVFDVAGRKVRTLVSESKPGGVHTIHWNGTDDAGVNMGSGVYFVKLSAPGIDKATKLIVVQ